MTKCIESDDGPLPVYKKNGSPCSYKSKIRSKSLCEKILLFSKMDEALHQ